MIVFLYWSSLVAEGFIIMDRDIVKKYLVLPVVHGIAIVPRRAAMFQPVFNPGDNTRSS
jgi:hypothetical protein